MSWIALFLLAALTTFGIYCLIRSNNHSFWEIFLLVMIFTVMLAAIAVGLENAQDIP